MTSEPTDEELVERANRGEAAAFERLYERHRDWAQRLALRFSRGPEDAQEVVQDAFLHLLGRFPGFRLSARLRTYLYPVVRHLARDRRERERRRSPPGAAPDPELVPDPAGPASPAALEDELRVVLAALPEPQREALLLRYVDDLELREIAQLQGVPLGTVKSRLHQALARLRDDPRTRAFFDV